MATVPDDFQIPDFNGLTIDMSYSHVSMLIGFGWGFYIVALISNVIFYAIHPSEVEIGRKITKQEKWYLPFCGSWYNIATCPCPKVDVEGQEFSVREQNGLTTTSNNNSIQLEMTDVNTSQHPLLRQ